MLEVTRLYKNASEETIRIDIITMLQSANCIVVDKDSITYTRNIMTQLLCLSNDRTISSIEILTNADNFDFDPSGTNNYEWVEWTHLSPSVRCNMSDLPQIGETL